MSKEIKEVHGVQPGRDWALQHDVPCPFAPEDRHVISKHPHHPLFFCANCGRSWLKCGVNLALDQRLMFPA